MFAKEKPTGLFRHMARASRIAILGASMLGAACTSTPQNVDADTPVATPTPGNTLMGNYLAGVHAQNEGDMGAAGLYLGAALDRDQNNTQLIRRAFLVHLSDGNMSDAIKLAWRVIELQPDDQFANLTLAADALKTGQYELARKRLDALPGGGLDSYTTPLLKAWSYIGDGGADADGAAALEALSPLEQSNGTTTIHTIHAALINAALGNNDKAEDLFINIIEIQGGMSLRKTRLFGAFYEEIGEFEKAGALYNGYIAEFGSEQYLQSALDRVANRTASTEATMTAAEGAAEALFDLSGSLRQQNASETALILSRIGLHMRPDFPSLQLVTGGVLESIGRYEAALEIYHQISPQSDYFWSARLRVATLLDDLGQPEQAVETLRQMAAERPDDPAPLIDIGDIMRSQEKYAEAVLAYESALSRLETVTEDYWSLHYALGISLERTHNWPGAEKNFKKALELRPDQPYVLNYLAYSWIEKGINLDQATEMLRNARDQRPNDAYIIDSVGWAHYQLGSYEDAVSELEDAVELLPQDPIVNDHLGDAYWQVGRKREARFQWRRALNMSPEPETIPLIENKIKDGLDVPQVKTEGEDDNS